MTDWSARSLLNVAYAYLTEQMDAADRVASPVFLSVGVDPKEVESMSRRDALETWLSPPSSKQLERETALLKSLGA